MEEEVQEENSTDSEGADDDPVRLREKAAKYKAIARALAKENQKLRERQRTRRGKKRTPHESAAGLILDSEARLERKKTEVDEVFAAAAAKQARAADRTRKRANREEEEAKKAEKKAEAARKSRKLLYAQTTRHWRPESATTRTTWTR
jgi:hypothetical protein